MQKYHNYTKTTVPGSGDKKIDNVADLSTWTVFFWHSTKIKKECGRRKLPGRYREENYFC